MWFLIGILFGIFSVKIFHAYTIESTESDEDIENMLPVNRYRSKQKEQNLKAVLRLFRDQKHVRNSDVQQLLDVSPKTARNYFDELEKESLITQHGTTGRDVYYILNR